MRIVRTLGIAAILLGIPAGAPPVGAVGEELSGWSATASASAYTVFPAVPSLVPYDAPIEATVSMTQAIVGTGGTGFGRASTLWPGVLAGLGPLVKQFDPNVPTLPDYPLVVESREFDEPKRTEQAGVVMATDVSAERAIAEAVASGQGAEGLLSVGSARSVSTSTVDAGSVVSESTAVVTDIVLAAGAVTIESVTTRSTAASDGETGSCDGGAIVSGLVVGGQPATVDETGVHAAGQDGALPADVNGTVAGVLDATGLQLRVIGAITDCDGPVAGRSTGGLLISMPLPAAGPIPPGGSLNIIVGSSAVAVEATRGASTDLPPPTLDPPPPFDSIGPPFTAVPAPVVDAPATTDAPATLTAIGDDRPAPYDFGGVPASMVAGTLLLALPATVRVRRYAERVIALAGR